MKQTKIPTASKSPRPLQIHLDRLKTALASIDIHLSGAKLLNAMSAFYGYRNQNALAAAAKAGELKIPEAEAPNGPSGTTTFRDPIANQDFGVVVPSRNCRASPTVVVSPYGNVLTLPPVNTTGGMFERNAERAKNGALRALKAYHGSDITWADVEEIAIDVILHLIHYRVSLNPSVDEDSDAEEKDANAILSEGLRVYMRECIGEVDGLGEPNISVDIYDHGYVPLAGFDSNLCRAAMEAYAPNSFDDEPDYVSIDLISDILHLIREYEHGNVLQTVKNVAERFSVKNYNARPAVHVIINV